MNIYIHTHIYTHVYFHTSFLHTHIDIHIYTSYGPYYYLLKLIGVNVFSLLSRSTLNTILIVNFYFFASMN